MKRLLSVLIMGVVFIGLWGCTPEVAEVEKSDAVAVKVATIEGSALKKQASFSAIVLANKEVGLSSGLSGEVVERLASVGSVVKKDQVLLVLDTETVDRSVEQSQSAYALAKVNYQSALDRYNDAVLNLERNKELYASGALSQSQFEQIEAAAKPFAVQSAKLQLEQSKLAYDGALSVSEGASVKAPFDGVISALQPQVGATLAPGQPIGSLVDLSTLKLSFDVTENLISLINFDTPVYLTIPALGPEKITAKVTAIAPVANTVSRLFPVEISFGNPELDIKPGMFAEVEVDLQSEAVRVLVPYDAVLYDEEGYYVYVVEKDLPVKRNIVLGDDNGVDIEILSGVSVGETLIITGQAFVKEDSILNIIKGE